ncbi:zinc ABC transporter substrate-binding protein [Vibrio sp.]|nr:zinc ABC transporter substrate-binding protein [Vibrio sp.]
MKKWLWLSSIVLSNPVLALNVVSSLKPIEMIVHEITGNKATNDVIVSNQASPHDFALKPSDITKIKQADAVIWYGEELEPFLEKPLSQRDNVLTISHLKTVDFIKFQEGEHHDDGHNHGNTDPHFWLGNQPTQQVASEVAQFLSNMDPNNAQEYQANLANFIQRLSEQKIKNTKQLDAVKDHGYYVFHDAYQYFERDYTLNKLGHFTVSPERKPGAKTLIYIKNKLVSGDVKCVFTEPQFKPAIVKSVVSGTNVTIGQLDPLASEFKAEKGSYFSYIDSIADSLSTCLR